MLSWNYSSHYFEEKEFLTLQGFIFCFIFITMNYSFSDSLIYINKKVFKWVFKKQERVHVKHTRLTHDNMTIFNSSLFQLIYIKFNCCWNVIQSVWFHSNKICMKLCVTLRHLVLSSWTRFLCKCVCAMAAAIRKAEIEILVVWNLRGVFLLCSKFRNAVPTMARATEY